MTAPISSLLPRVIKGRAEFTHAVFTPRMGLFFIPVLGRVITRATPSDLSSRVGSQAFAPGLLF